MSNKSQQETHGEQSPNIDSGGGKVNVTYSAPNSTAERPVAGVSKWEKIASFIFGVIFVAVLLTITIFIPNPTPTQHATFQTVLSLAAAGVGGVLAGFLHVEGTIKNLTVRAAGALALFVMVFFFTPPMPEQDVINQTMEGGHGVQIGENKGVINIGPGKTDDSKEDPVELEKKDSDGEGK